MNKTAIKPGKWYETKLGVGKCTRAGVGGCFPWTATINITYPFPRDALKFAPRDVLRETPKPPKPFVCRCGSGFYTVDELRDHVTSDPALNYGSDQPMTHTPARMPPGVIL
jgi:hypothetical protein